VHKCYQFGARSVPTGRVEIIWTIDEWAKRLHVVWTERGGLAVEPPKGAELWHPHDGTERPAHLAYEPAGYVYSLEVPLSSVKADA
jgi:hypothetical protein